MVNPYWELIILFGMVNIIFAISLNLILGYNGQFSLGHAGFLAIGAYSSAVLTKVCHWPMWAGILAAIVFTVIAAVIIGYPCLRLGGDYLAIATLGFAEIIRIVFNALPTETFGGATGMREVYRFKEIVVPQQFNGVGNFLFALIFAVLFLGMLLWGIWAFVNFVHRIIIKKYPWPHWRFALLGLIAVLVIVFWRNIVSFYTESMSLFQFQNSFKQVSFDSNQWAMFLLFFIFVGAVLWITKNYLNSLPGRSVVAIRDDEIAATNLGINISWLKLQNFMIGCGIAGFAGGLAAHTWTLFKPLDFDFFKSVDVLLMVVLGGMGSLTGSVLGATTITFLPEVLRFIGQWRMVIYSLILILLMIYRSEGMMGTSEIGHLINFKRLAFWRKATVKSDA